MRTKPHTINRGNSLLNYKPSGRNQSKNTIGDPTFISNDKYHTASLCRPKNA